MSHVLITLLQGVPENRLGPCPQRIHHRVEKPMPTLPGYAVGWFYQAREATGVTNSM